jgi:hypothetical protein
VTLTGTMRKVHVLEAGASRRGLRLTPQLVNQPPGSRGRLRTDLVQDPFAALVRPQHTLVVAACARQEHQQAPRGLVERLGIEGNLGELFGSSSRSAENASSAAS